MSKKLDIFYKLYEEYVNDLQGWSMMNTSLARHQARDNFYKERTFRLCEAYRKEIETKIWEEYQTKGEIEDFTLL
jgi:hypothetical protein